MATTTLLTFEEFERLPEEPGKMELLDGEVILLPPAFLKHMQIVHRLYDQLRPLVQAAGLAEVYMETGYKIGGKNWLVPDVSITHVDQPAATYLEGAPVLAIEVISPSNTAEQIDRKVKIYLANGSQEVWVVYPRTECVWAYRPGHAEEFRGELRSSIAPALPIDLTQLFPHKSQPPTSTGDPTEPRPPGSGLPPTPLDSLGFPCHSIPINSLWLSATTNCFPAPWTCSSSSPSKMALPMVTPSWRPSGPVPGSCFAWKKARSIPLSTASN